MPQWKSSPAFTVLYAIGPDQLHAHWSMGAEMRFQEARTILLPILESSDACSGNFYYAQLAAPLELEKNSPLEEARKRGLQRSARPAFAPRTAHSFEVDASRQSLEIRGGSLTTSR
ncbi:hypothetical protein BC567DRAFT_208540 [Phyllosticta citribraziliensis]